MITWLRRWWNRRLRATDKRILLPIILEKAKSMQQAVHVLTVHVAMDHAWSDLTDEEKAELILDWIEEGWKDVHPMV